MGEGDQRRFKRNARYDTRELARLSGRTGVKAEPEPRPPERTARGSDPPMTSRTATLDDPLTTSLLAEVVRRSMTIEVLPEQIDEAKDIELAAPDARAGEATDPTADAAESADPP